MTALATQAVGLIRGRGPAAAVLDEGRSLLLGGLAEPASASELARRFGQPRQRVNYHLRELEKAGLVRLVEERRKGNCLERVVVATARSYLISPEALGAISANPDNVADRASSGYLLAAAGEALREVGVLRDRAEGAGKRLATLTLRTRVKFESAEGMNRFAEDLTAAVARVVAEHHREDAAEVGGGREFKLMVASYPAITKDDEPSAQAEEAHRRVRGARGETVS